MNKTKIPVKTEPTKKELEEIVREENKEKSKSQNKRENRRERRQDRRQDRRDKRNVFNSKHKYRKLGHIGSVGHNYYIINFYEKVDIKFNEIFKEIRYRKEDREYDKYRRIFNSKCSVIIDKKNKEKAKAKLKSAGLENKQYEFNFFTSQDDYFKKPRMIKELSNKEIKKEYKSGIGTTKIAGKRGVDPETIRKRLIDEDEKRRQRKIKIPLWKIKKTYRETKSTYKTAELLGGSHQTIGRRLEKTKVKFYSRKISSDEEIVNSYNQTKNMKKTARECHAGSVRVKKILVHEGIIEQNAQIEQASQPSQEGYRKPQNNSQAKS